MSYHFNYSIDENIKSSCLNGLCWLPLTPSADEWLQIDLLQLHLVGIVSLEYRHDWPYQTRFKDIEVRVKISFFTIMWEMI